MAEIKIFAPVKSYAGKIGNITFVDGVGVADDEKHQSELKYFKRKKGFGIGKIVDTDSDVDEVEEPVDQEVDTEEVEEPETVDVPGMPGSKAKRPEWVEFAEGMGISTEGLSISQIRQKVIEQHLS